MLQVEQGVSDDELLLQHPSHGWHYDDVLQCTQQRRSVSSEDKQRLNFLELMSLSTVPMALKAITLLDVPQIMAAAGDDKMLTAKDIATEIINKSSMKATKVNVHHLDRILRFLSSCDIFSESVTRHGEFEERCYGLNPICKYLLKNAGGASLSTLLLVRHDKQLFQSLHHLHDAVLGDEVPFAKAHGENLFQFLEEHPQEGQLFNTAMSNMSEIYMGAIIDKYHGFKDVQTLVDVGGGTGSSLSMIMAKYRHIRGVNFDLPHVVANALRFPGMEHVGGNMFEDVPSGDAIFLKHIMHNWSDEHCIKTLKNCYRALSVGGKIIIVEFLAPELGDHSQRARVALSYDLVMMAHFLGKERSEREFRGLLRLAGFSRVHVALKVDCVAVVEAYKSI